MNSDELNKFTNNYKEFLKYNIAIDQSLVSGKTFEEWKKYFTFKIPTQPDLIIIRSLLSLVGDKLQECENFVSTLSNSDTFLENRVKELFETTKADLLEKKTVTANTKAESLARKTVVGINEKRNAGKMVLEFFKNQKYKMLNTLEILKQHNSSLMSEMKNLNYTGLHNGEKY